MNKEFANWLAQVFRVEPAQIGQMIQQVAQDEQGKQVLEALSQAFQQGMSPEEASQALQQSAGQSQMFRAGGKMNAFVNKFAKGGIAKAKDREKAPEKKERTDGRRGYSYVNSNGNKVLARTTTNDWVDNEGNPSGYTYDTTIETEQIPVMNQHGEVVGYKYTGRYTPESLQEIDRVNHDTILFPAGEFKYMDNPNIFQKIVGWRQTPKGYGNAFMPGVNGFKNGGVVKALFGIKTFKQSRADRAANEAMLNDVYNEVTGEGGRYAGVDPSKLTNLQQNALNQAKSMGYKGRDAYVNAAMLMRGTYGQQTSTPEIQNPQNAANTHFSSQAAALPGVVASVSQMPTEQELDYQHYIAPGEQEMMNDITKMADTNMYNTVADNVIAGKYGNGADRRKAITDAGLDYDRVQALVNQRMRRPVNSDKLTVREWLKRPAMEGWTNEEINAAAHNPFVNQAIQMQKAKEKTGKTIPVPYSPLR